MRRKPDMQRNRLYSAESRGWFNWNRKLSSVEEAQAIVNKAWSKKPLLRRWPVDGPPPTVQGQKTGVYATGGPTCITLPVKWALQTGVLYHELAHSFAIRSKGARGHGWEFARAMLDIVQFMEGAPAEKELRVAFKARKVKFYPPKTRRKATPEEREILTARLVKAREAKQKTS